MIRMRKARRLPGGEAAVRMGAPVVICFEMKRIVRSSVGLVASLLALPASGLDLSRAVVRGPANPTMVETKAVQTLVEEVEKRTQFQLATTGAGSPVIELRRGSGPADGYTLSVEAGRVVVSGNDARGVLFGVGRLLRESRMERQSFTIADGLKITEDRSVSCLRVIRPESADVSRLGLGLPGSNLGRQLLAAERWFLSTMG